MNTRQEQALTHQNLFLDGVIPFDKEEYEFNNKVINGERMVLPNGFTYDYATDKIVEDEE